MSSEHNSCTHRPQAHMQPLFPIFTVFSIAKRALTDIFIRLRVLFTYMRCGGMEWQRVLAECPLRYSTLATTLRVLCFFPPALAALFVVASAFFIRTFSYPLLLKLLFLFIRQLGVGSLLSHFQHSRRPLRWHPLRFLLRVVRHYMQ